MPAHSLSRSGSVPEKASSCWEPRHRLLPPKLRTPKTQSSRGGREAPMKNATKQSQCGRPGIHFLSDAIEGNGGSRPKCLTDCNCKGQHRQLHDLGWIRHCEAVVHRQPSPGATCFKIASMTWAL